MEKIKTVFKIDRDSGLAIDEVVPASSWYQDPDVSISVKIDGRSFAVINGKPYVRYDRKIQDKFRHLVGKQEITEDLLKGVPAEGIPCEPCHDPKTGHHPFWVPPQEAWILEVFEKQSQKEPLLDGTYELIGPKVRCNVYNEPEHKLVKHGSTLVSLPDKSFEGIKQSLAENPAIEGYVFSRIVDGKMQYAKVRQKDFGFSWNSAAEGIRAKRK